VIIYLDFVISNLETLIWEREFPKHENVSDTEKAIHWDGYVNPVARTRNQILFERNRIAYLLGIHSRSIHDISPNALGYYCSLSGYFRIMEGGPDELISH
jgi:hypothetical protein